MWCNHLAIESNRGTRMTRFSPTGLRPVILALGVLLVLAQAAAAYEGEVDAQIGIKGPTTADCPEPVAVTARVFDKEGNPLAGQEVVWSTGEVGTTDANGYVTLHIVVSGDLTVRATTGESSAQITIVCERHGAVAGVKGLPRTDTEAPAGPGLAILAGLGLLGAALIGRRALLGRG
jgi:Bacterial Ig-like domain (group 1)